MYEAKILADSMSPDGVRLTTMEIEYPHAIHKDIMTHRMFSRNFQSFRACPPEKVIERIEHDPFIPDAFRTRVKGMGEGMAAVVQELPRELWMAHIDHSLDTARRMIGLNMAKAQINFVLQDLASIRGIISATEWENFWNLRLALDSEDRPLARPEVYRIALMMQQAYDASEPEDLGYDEWHVPLADWSRDYTDTLDWDMMKELSTGRCARVSYLTHDGVRDLSKDLELHDNLLADGHMSPFEHIARPIPITGAMYVDEIDQTSRKSTGLLLPGPDWRANFFGWHQYRLDVEARNA